MQNNYWTPAQATKIDPGFAGMICESKIRLSFYGGVIFKVI